ncbi:OLC1v1028144C1 [Oldenlandia corymbosa var. corymbosa]|uniref:OLC1v1028144C1 n=1 Tax=Oldenlandia corymbosa var. corymbosa TaxID=529605 RepID=A0AAV1CE35_OLDCO|nr:OLC1v1028144C1 [Oldenlandia corymbosa var. corymbosa]
MAESMVERPAVENKMDNSVSSADSLQVSVSFGKYESDSLSWEKWSSFSPNKYLEEVEKCKTPGSVAQKKAYFEAHYKKIAAKKTEQLEQESLMESVPPCSVQSDCKNFVGQRSLPSDEDTSLASGGSPERVEPVVAVEDKLMFTPGVEEKEHDAISVGSQGLSVEVDKEELNGTSINHEADVVEEIKGESTSNQAEVESRSEEGATVVQVDISKSAHLEIVEQPLKVANEVKKTPQNNKKSSKVHPANATKKMTPTRVEKVSAGSKKTAASPASKSSTVTKMSQLSTPKLSKSTMMPSSRPSAKKVNETPALPRVKNSPMQNGRERPASLHMSLSLDPASSGPSPSITRKSLIMESMGDKDIVRRAFKTFQNSLNGLRYSNDGTASSPQQVSVKGSLTRISTNVTPRKENEGPKKSAEKVSQRSRSGTTSSSLSSWSAKGSGFDRKNASVVSSSTGVRADAKAEKWKEKPGEKSFVKEGGGLHHSAKAKEGQPKNVRQGLKPQTTSAPSFNRGLGTMRISPGKEDKRKIHRGPLSKV